MTLEKEYSTKTHDELVQLVADSIYWSRTDAGVLIRKTDAGLDFVSYENLLLLHPNLPVLLKFMEPDIDVNEHKFAVSWATVAITLEYWKDSHQILRDASGVEYTVQELDTLYDTGNLAIFNATVYNVKECVTLSDGVTVGILFADNASDQMISVEKSWLDEHYPNWKAKWNIAATLDMSADACAQLVLSSSELLPDVALRDITFN